MSEDISPEAYTAYLRKHAQYTRLWPNLAGQLKTYEEWSEAMQHRDHPLWTEYMDAYRTWKDVNFAFIYGPGPVPSFAPFTEWLANMEKLGYTEEQS